MEKEYFVVMVTVSGSSYRLFFRGSFEDALCFAKRAKRSRTDKIYMIRLIHFDI